MSNEFYLRFKLIGLKLGNISHPTQNFSPSRLPSLFLYSTASVKYWRDRKVLEKNQLKKLDRCLPR